MIKNFTKLSKQLLLDLCKPKYVDNKIESLEPEYKDYRKCKKSFPRYYENKLTCNVCINCPFILSGSSIKVARTNALTFTQIKQLLLYHSLVFENNGITQVLNHAYVANMLNCSIKTARDNLKVLESSGYIYCSSRDLGNYAVYITDYEKYHKGGNRGYLTINKRVLQSLLNTDNINELRLALNCIVKVDDLSSVVKNKKKDSNNAIKKFTFKSLINILPSYIYSELQIRDILNKLSLQLNLFNVKYKNDSICISFTDIADTNIYAKGLHSKHKKAIKTFFKKHRSKLQRKDQDDLLQLSMQYNINIVLKSLSQLKNNNILKLGAYLRTLIRLNFNSTVLTPSYSIFA